VTKKSPSSFDAQRLDASADANEIISRAHQLSAQVDPVAQLIERLVENGEGNILPDTVLQRLFKACVQIYAQKVDGGNPITPCGNSRDLSATSVMLTASGLLKGANLEMFELGMWQSFSGTR
jgi:hypothetical protein